MILRWNFALKARGNQLERKRALSSWAEWEWKNGRDSSCQRWWTGNRISNKCVWELKKKKNNWDSLYCVERKWAKSWSCPDNLPVHINGRGALTYHMTLPSWPQPSKPTSPPTLSAQSSSLLGTWKWDRETKTVNVLRLWGCMCISLETRQTKAT